MYVTLCENTYVYSKVCVRWKNADQYLVNNKLLLQLLLFVIIIITIIVLDITKKAVSSNVIFLFQYSTE